jgi:pyruvate formate lyase activating enzyme
MKEARYWSSGDIEKKTVLCGLCPHVCLIAPDKTGICGARKNISGQLFSLSYNSLTSVNLDPIEKKPLYHFHPGTKILSVGSFGCNFKCRFCQNWEISQSAFGEAPVKTFNPEEIVKMALNRGSVGIAYTYNEPLMNYEWVKDTAKLVKDGGLVNVLVSNGYINSKPFQELLPLIDAANIDIKAFTDDFYKKLCGGKLSPVLETVTAMEKAGKHVEITTLLIPGENDSAGEIEKLSAWIAGLNPEIPLHFSRYFPSYKMDNEPTAVDSLRLAWSIAKKKLKHVYVGNIASAEFSRTLCPACGGELIERNGYDINIKNLKDGCCAKCGSKINIKSKQSSNPNYQQYKSQTKESY